MVAAVSQPEEIAATLGAFTGPTATNLDNYGEEISADMGTEVYDSFTNVAEVPLFKGMDQVTYQKANIRQSEELSLSFHEAHPLMPVTRYYKGTPRVEGGVADPVKSDCDRIPSHPQNIPGEESDSPSSRKQGDEYMAGKRTVLGCDADFNTVNIGRTPVAWLQFAFFHACPTFAKVDDDHKVYDNDKDGCLNLSVTPIDFAGGESPFKRKLVKPERGKNPAFIKL